MSICVHRHVCVHDICIYTQLVRKNLKDDKAQIGLRKKNVIITIGEIAKITSINLCDILISH